MWGARWAGVRRDPKPNLQPNPNLTRYAVTFISLASFHHESVEFGERFSMLLTIMLTAVAFKYNVTQKLPALPYQTDLDQFINLLFLFITLVAVYNMLLPFALNYRCDVGLSCT